MFTIHRTCDIILKIVVTVQWSKQIRNTLLWLSRNIMTILQPDSYVRAAWQSRGRTLCVTGCLRLS